VTADQLNQLANVITALAVLVGALPLLLKAIHEITHLRRSTETAAAQAAESLAVAVQATGDLTAEIRRTRHGVENGGSNVLAADGEPRSDQR